MNSGFEKWTIFAVVLVVVVVASAPAFGACPSDGTRIRDFSYEVEPQVDCVDAALVGDLLRRGCETPRVWVSNACETELTFPAYDQHMECSPEVGNMDDASECEAIAAGETGWVFLELDEEPNGDMHETNYDINVDQTDATLDVRFRTEPTSSDEDSGCSVAGSSRNPAFALTAFALLVVLLGCRVSRWE